MFRYTERPELRPVVVGAAASDGKGWMNDNDTVYFSTAKTYQLLFIVWRHSRSNAYGSLYILWVQQMQGFFLKKRLRSIEGNLEIIMNKELGK